MILSDKVDILITKKNVSFYNKILSDIEVGINISIPIEKLPKGSNIKIKVQCDYCQKEKELSYKNYNKSLKIEGRYSCSQKCSYLKKSELLKRESGIENIFQSKEIKEKIKKNNLDKWGVENYTQTNDFREKTKNTLLRTLGVSNPMQSEEIKEKVKKTNFEKWGGTGFQSEKVSEKIKTTNLEKWGLEITSKSEEIKEKVKKTNFEKWGGTGFQSNILSSKSKNTILKKYGTSSNTQGEIFRKENYKLAQDPQYLFYYGGGVSIFQCQKGHTFSINKDNYNKRSVSENPLCTICYPISDTQSIKQKILTEFISKLNVEFITSYRDELEIDVYLPQFNLGFEFNGLYWHSDQQKDKNYHLNKTNHFKNRGIKIIHIWEDDWNSKKDIIESQIKHFLGFSKKLSARKCQLKQISNDITNDFLNKNHIQGSYNGIKLSLGLFFGDELVSVMTFDKQEGRKKLLDNEWNLSRFCNKQGTSVIGGASKLLKNFIRSHNPVRIISYADKDWSNGNLYEKLGFYKLYETRPDYKYIVKGKRIHKSSFRKSNTGISEKFLNIPKIYDCGKIKFQMTNIQR